MTNFYYQIKPVLFSKLNKSNSVNVYLPKVNYLCFSSLTVSLFFHIFFFLLFKVQYLKLDTIIENSLM